MVYSEFGGQTECIMGNWKIENIILVSLVLNSWILIYPMDSQRAKKVVSESLGLVDFAIGLVNSVFNLPDWQVMFFEEFE